MAILDDILNRGKNKGANSFLPLDEQGLHEESNNTPEIPVLTTSDQDNKQPTEIIQSNPEGMPENKWGYSDSVFNTLAKAGYTPKKLDYLLNDFDPSKGESFLQRIYESSVSKPSPPDEKKLRNARTIAGVADGVGMLSQIFAAGKGAHVKERNAKQLALSQVEGKEKELRDRYLQLSTKYNDGFFNARLKDFLKSLEDYHNGRKGIQNVLAQKAALDERARQADDKLEYNYNKLKQDQANKDRDREDKKAYQAEMIKQGLSRVTDSKNRTSAYVKKVSSSGSTKNNYQMIFEASPDDTKDVQTDEFGNKVKVFEMTKGQIDQYARQALSDSDFMSRHPELVLQKPDIIGSGSFKYKPNADIAAAYLKEQYDNSLSSSQSALTPYNWNFNQAFNPVAIQDPHDDNDEDEEEEEDEFPALGNINIANF